MTKKNKNKDKLSNENIKINKTEIKNNIYRSNIQTKLQHCKQNEFIFNKNNNSK